MLYENMCQGPHCTGKMATTKNVRENTGNLKILSKDRDFFAQVVNSLIMKVKDIAIFASWICLPGEFCL